MTTKKIIVIDDEEFIRINLKNIFSSEGYEVDVSETGEEGILAIEKKQYDIAFLDVNLPDINGLELLQKIKKNEPDLLIIIITGFASIESAISSIKLGAYDYIKKPFKADAIKLITKLALETQSLKKRVEKLEIQQKPSQGIDSIIGTSEEIRKIKSNIIEFAQYDSGNILITGESGSGKELIASAIHKLSPRSSKSFVEINCASIPENLLESELFGYEKGAFTDAKDKKTGLIEVADGGTLFLDEIGEMSLNLQAKLLRVLENQKIRRLGSNKDITVDLRIIAATNKNLKIAINNSEFREDFYYRLNVLNIKAPPLKKRGEDIILLAEYFLNHFKKRFSKKIDSFSQDAKEALLNYTWPGNVRELKNVIERTCILTKNSVITSRDIAADFVSIHEDDEIKIMQPDFNLEDYSYEEIVNDLERQLIIKAIEMSKGNISEAARKLKLPRETLRYKLTKLQIHSEEEK